MKKTILDNIGNTPLVEIQNLNPNPNVQILAKLEYFNPGSSIKDRTALFMINDAEKKQQLTKDKIVIEATSGNTGIGLALVCSIKGYKFFAVMSEGASLERIRTLKAMGASILLTPKEFGTDGAIEEVYKIVRENPNKYFMTDQFNNNANMMAHYFGTAEEIIKQTNGELDYVISTLGTSGTAMGLSKRLKEHNKNIKIIGVEPYLGHKIQGLKNMKEAYTPELFDKNKLDEKIYINDDEAFEMTRKLARKEGIFAGMSSGAAMVIALKYAKKIEKGKIVVIIPDSGERYLSTPLFDLVKKTGIKIYNSLSRKKEDFTPIKTNEVSIYSCGPTVYRRINIDEMRRYIFIDFVASYFKYKGYRVKHIVNITDLDDKTIDGAKEDSIALEAFTEKHIKQFYEDLKEIKVDAIDTFPQVSKETDFMVKVAERLCKKGFAYEKLKSLYYNISAFKDYGKLSGIDVNAVRVGATVDLDNYEKENPRDFTLFKRAKLSDLKVGAFINTPWGKVRPSLHLQCAAIAMKYLGEDFDFHISPKSLIFPHNENELAIAFGVSKKKLARCWINCEKVLRGGKTIKEKDFLNIDDIKKLDFNIQDLRYWILSAHYRKTVNFSKNALESGRASLKKINQCIKKLIDIENDIQSVGVCDQILYDIKNGFINAMDDDFNVSLVFANLFKTIKKINLSIINKKLSKNNAKKIIQEFKNINTVLKIFTFEKKEIPQETKDLLEKRDIARKEKNWTLADEIRDLLILKGHNVQDESFE